MITARMLLPNEPVKTGSMLARVIFHFHAFCGMKGNQPTLRQARTFLRECPSFRALLETAEEEGVLQ